MKEKLVVLTALAVLMVSSPVFAQRYNVVDLGTFGGSWSQPYGINDLGQVVGYSTKGVSDYAYAFIWQNGVIQDLGIGRSSVAYDINNSGQIVGVDNSSGRAFLWDSVNGRKNILDSSSVARSINNNGQVAGFICSRDGFCAFIWDNVNGTQNLGAIPGYSPVDTMAYAINDRAQIVGYSFWPMRAFLWQNNEMSDLGALPCPGAPFWSQAYGINNKGEVVGRSNAGSSFCWVGYGGNEDHAFLWDSTNGMRDLGTLGGKWSAGYTINDFSQVVGSSETNSGNHAFLWENGVMKNLNDFIPNGIGWDLVEARSINNVGQIVGSGIYEGQQRAFILNPVVRNVPQEAQNATLHTTNGHFHSQYKLSFEGDCLKINLPIRLIGIDPGDEVRQIWEEGAERVWSNQYDVVYDNTSYGIVLDVKFVNFGEGATFRVVQGEGSYFVGMPGEWYTDSVFSWGPDYRDEAVAHEIGHLLGLYDEYYQNGRGVLDPDNPIIDPTSIMGSLDGMPKERHFQDILEWLKGETGFNMVLAPSPLWRPGEVGPPVNDGSPVPEPSGITFLIMGTVIIFLKKRNKSGA